MKEIPLLLKSMIGKQQDLYDVMGDFEYAVRFLVSDEDIVYDRSVLLGRILLMIDRVKDAKHPEDSELLRGCLTDKAVEYCYLHSEHRNISFDAFMEMLAGKKARGAAAAPTDDNQ